MSTQASAPRANGSAVYCTLYQRKPGLVALAEAELQALAPGVAAEPGVWLSSQPIPWAATGYGNAGGRQLAFGETLEALRDALLALQLVSPRFSIETRRLPRGLKGATLAKTLIGDCIEGDVDVADPALRLLLVMSRRGYRVLEIQPMRPGDADWLGVAHKPHNYLVALPVRIAKAMLNLTVSAGDSVLDPFCGSGTIPILAAWAGHTAFGGDIGPACVARAEENAAHFGQPVTFKTADARHTEQRADCVIANLPYGVYCHLEREGLRAVLKNLATRAARVTLVTSERIEDALHQEDYAVEQILSVEPERFERFVYVTRTPT